MVFLLIIISLLGAISAFFSQGYLFIVILIAALIVLIYNKPLFGAVFVTALAFLYNVGINVPSPYRTSGELISLGVIIIIIIYLIVLPNLIQLTEYSNTHVKKIVFLIALLFGWAAISLLWTHDIYHGANVVLTFLAVFLMFQIFLFQINDKAALFGLLYACIFIGVTLGIILVVSIWYNSGNTFNISNNVSLTLALISDKGRPGGFAPHDLAASIMNRFAFIGLALMYKDGSLRRTLTGLAIAFFVVCSILTASKAGVLTLFAGASVFILANPLLRRWRLRLSLAFSAFMAFLLISSGNLLIRRMQIFFEKTSDRGYLSDRMELWGKGYDKFLETYGIGVGAGGFSRYIDPVPGAHTFFGSILFELGVVGVIIFIMIIFSIIVYLREATKTCRDKEMIFVVHSFVASIISMFLQASIEGDFHQMHVWIIPAMLVAVLNNTRDPIK